MVAVSVTGKAGWLCLLSLSPLRNSTPDTNTQGYGAALYIVCNRWQYYASMRINGISPLSMLLVSNRDTHSTSGRAFHHPCRQPWPSLGRCPRLGQVSSQAATPRRIVAPPAAGQLGASGQRRTLNRQFKSYKYILILMLSRFKITSELIACILIFSKIFSDIKDTRMEL